MASFLVVAETAGQRAPPGAEGEPSEGASSGKAASRAAAKSERSSARRLATRGPPVADASVMFAARGSDMRAGCAAWDARERHAKGEGEEKAERGWRRRSSADRDGASGDR